MINARLGPCHESASEAIPGEFLLNIQGKRADAVWTEQGFTALCEHLHNDNADKHWIMGFRKNGEKVYKRSKTKRVRDGISWGWKSIIGRTKPGGELAFAAYSCNKEGQSRWAAMDFDAHNGEDARARRLAFAAFCALLNVPDLTLILESTGSGGWHVWLIAQYFHPVDKWVKLLKATASRIGAPVVPGVCEIFPPDSVPSDFGLGVRVPGSWNPRTDIVGEIFWENTKPLLASLSGKYACINAGYFPDKRKKVVSFTPSQATRVESDHRLYFMWKDAWSSQYAITQPSTRNNQLCSLTGEMFFQVGFEMGKRIADAQYADKTVVTSADRQAHADSFTQCWHGLVKRWKARLYSAEASLLAQLSTEHERDAFRIIWSYALKASQDGCEDFPIARDNLADRLGITGPGAGGIRSKFTTLGIIRLAQHYQPNKRAARYVWLSRSRTEFTAAESFVDLKPDVGGLLNHDQPIKTGTSPNLAHKDSLQKTP